MADDVQNIRTQLFKLFWSNLVKDPTDPSENEIIVLGILGEYVSSKR